MFKRVFSQLASAFGMGTSKVQASPKHSQGRVIPAAVFASYQRRAHYGKMRIWRSYRNTEGVVR